MLVEGLAAMRPSVAAGNLLASRTYVLKSGTYMIEATWEIELYVVSAPCKDLPARFCGTCYWSLLAGGTTAAQGHAGTARVALVPITGGGCACTMSSNLYSQLVFCLDAGLD